MIVRELNNIKEIKQLNKPVELDTVITDFYACDLLSFVMGHATQEGTCLITAITNMNVIAIASLLEYSAIIFVEDMTPSEEVIMKAESLNIPLFKTTLSSLKIYKEILDYESQI